ncbi:UPF0481 protein At3g47200-like [Aegilops tauschii subsp. strangulata]|uniref:Uncharacterized protein n=1 Tax=Aegilops tauschii subsp. strangulata TaxID=200361 RepID=A0A453SRS6_AEGTS|nr:UPF0481 protein At3g47200-like [Aegilops tauschii subsp. strangulata]
MNTSISNSVHTPIIVEIPGELDELSQASQKLETAYSNIFNKIHRFPASLRSLDGDYIVPRMVSIGAYHHGRPELQGMEEIKKAAAHHFCRDSGHSPEAVYEKVLAVAGDARSCYTDGGAAGALEGDDFASMMLRDGCFLLQLVLWFLQDCSGDGKRGPPPFTCQVNSLALLRDLFLLENQIPWAVLEALMACRAAVFPAALCEFVVYMGKFFQLHTDTDLLAKPLDLDGGYRPAHLLALLHFHQSGGSSTTEELRLRGLRSLPPVVTNAVDFAEMGIKLAPSKTAEFRDMALTQGLLFPELSMPPLYLAELTASWLVNMAAFEASTGVPHGATSGEYTVSSYLTLLSALMDREEDVRELCAKRLVQSELTDGRTLAFFKGGLTSYAYVNDRYMAILSQIAGYRRRRRLWIAVHKFVYTNFRTIVTLLSVVSVLVGLFKALLSLSKA